jgi:hypothetical protein
VSASDALIELLDLPTAYRTAFNAPGGDVRRRIDSSGWTAIEHATHTAKILHSTRKRLVLVFEGADRDVAPPPLETVRASARGAPPELVLASVSAACHDLAQLVGGAPDHLWDHTARHDGEVITARALLADALHEAHHHAFDAHAASGLATARSLVLAPA